MRTYGTFSNSFVNAVKKTVEAESKAYLRENGVVGLNGWDRRHIQLMDSSYFRHQNAWKKAAEEFLRPDIVRDAIRHVHRDFFDGLVAATKDPLAAISFVRGAKARERAEKTLTVFVDGRLSQGDTKVITRFPLGDFVDYLKSRRANPWDIKIFEQLGNESLTPKKLKNMFNMGPKIDVSKGIKATLSLDKDLGAIPAPSVFKRDIC